MQRLVLLYLAALWASTTIASSDVLITNARVYTLDPTKPWAEAVAITGEHIAWVGSMAEAAAHRDDQTRIIDAGSRLLLPGFIDSHNHIRYGNEPLSIDLSEARNLKEIRATVATFAEEHPELPWLLGGGWSYDALPDGILPTAVQLEGVTDDRPAYLVSYDGHTVWLNRAAMLAIGLTRGSALADSGFVERDAQGEPTGVVYGAVSLGSANPVLQRLWEELPEEYDLLESLTASLAQAASFGITTIVAPQTELEGVATFLAARDAGVMKSRIITALFHPVDTDPDALALYETLREQYTDERFDITAIKLYIDDVIEARTAAMLDAYADRPDARGELFYPPERFAELVARLDRRKFQLFIHAIGDRG
ncbi:MAG: amidohydrolase family protein, partial [Pseudomonadota bacterium]